MNACDFEKDLQYTSTPYVASLSYEYSSFGHKSGLLQ